MTGDPGTTGQPGMNGQPGFEVRLESEGGIDRPAVLCLSGELDSLSAAQLSASLDRVDPRARRVILDMRDVSFIDSSGLRMLITAREMFAGNPDPLALRDPQPSTTRLLELTGLTDYFIVVDRGSAG